MARAALPLAIAALVATLALGGEVAPVASAGSLLHRTAAGTAIPWPSDDALFGRPSDGLASDRLASEPAPPAESSIVLR